MKLIQHVELEPGWPEYGFRLDGSSIRLADVEATLPEGDARGNVYFLHPRKPGVRVYPWREAGYYVNEAGEILTASGPLPMSVADLAGLGLTDEQLFAEHALYYREPAVAPHHHADADAQETQRLRRRVYDEVMAAWYGEQPMPRLHPGG